VDDSVKLKRLQKELTALKEQQRGAGVSDEEYQILESDKSKLQGQLNTLIEEKEMQRVSESFNV
jgi:hypothetical protein